jgi:hypothetical protein
VPHFVNLQAHYLVALFAKETPGGRARDACRGEGWGRIRSGVVPPPPRPFAERRPFRRRGRHRAGDRIVFQTRDIPGCGVFLRSELRVFTLLQLSGFHLLDAAVGGADLLDGIEKFAGRARLELASSESLSDVGEGVADCVEIVERLNFEPVRQVIAKSAGATQASAALHEVVIAVFAIAKRRRAAVGSVFFFDVATSFVLHDGQIPFGAAVPLAHLENKGLIERLAVSLGKQKDLQAKSQN